MHRFAEHLELQDFRDKTKCNYYRVINVISNHFDKDPALLEGEDLRAFFVHVRCERGWAPKTTRQFVAGLLETASQSKVPLSCRGLRLQDL